VALVYGDSAKWLHFLKHRAQPQDVQHGLLFLLRVGGKYAIEHGHLLLRQAVHTGVLWLQRHWQHVLRHVSSQAQS